MKRNWLISLILTVLVLGTNVSLPCQASDKINMTDTLDEKAIVKVEAYWEPIADASLGMPNQSPEHVALFGDLSPALPSQEYEADAFKVFFPKGSVDVGSVWELDANEVIRFFGNFTPGQQRRCT